MQQRWQKVVRNAHVVVEHVGDANVVGELGRLPVDLHLVLAQGQADLEGGRALENGGRLRIFRGRKENKNRCITFKYSLISNYWLLIGCIACSKKNNCHQR